MVRILLVLALALCLWPSLGAAEDAMSAALNQARAMAMRPLPVLPAPEPPREVYVPERRVWVPGYGVHAIVPGHWERRVSDNLFSVPLLTIIRDDGAVMLVTPGERPPAEWRHGP